MDGGPLARLILSRCGDALNEAEIADVSARAEGAVVPMTAFDHAMTVIGALQARINDLEERVGAPAEAVGDIQVEIVGDRAEGSTSP
jgi:hypothetical protein